MGEKVVDVKEVQHDDITDVLGAGEVMKKITKHWNEKKKECEERTTPGQDSFWGYMVGSVKTESQIPDTYLARAGVPPRVLIDAIVEQGETPTNNAVYRTLHLKKADGSEQTVPIDKAAEMLAPHADNFTSPMEAMVRGNPDSVLSVIQHVFGEDVVEWWVPAEAAEMLLAPFKAMVVAEMYHVDKFGNPSGLFEKKDGQIVVKEEVEPKVGESFDRSDLDYLKTLFPNVNFEYVQYSIVQESVKRVLPEVKTPINLKSTEEVDLLFPNINKDYLVHIKESYGGGGILALFDQRLHDEASEVEEDEEKSD